MRQRTILITGSSDGIGLALARHYQAQGACVISCGRRPITAIDPRLQADYCRVDVTQASAAAIIIAFLQQRAIQHLDIMIHCAGIGSYGSPAAQLPGEIDALLDTNLRAPIALTHALLPWLARAHGRLVFIGSVAATMPVPDYAVYGASKAALEGFARSLRSELGGNIGVQIIHPGATRTAMHAKSGVPLEHIGWQRFPAPEHVAQQIGRAIERGTPLATIGVGNRLLRLASRHLGRTVDWVARRAGSQQQATIPAAYRGHAAGMRHCVITGGADGIGRAVAEHYANAGYAVTIIDRDAERAHALCHSLQAAGATATYLIADLAQASSIAELLLQLTTLPPIHVFVHSAGISAVGAFANSDLSAQHAVLDLNLRAPLQLSAGMLGAQLLAPAATLVFIASLSVYTSYPGASVYAASKDGIAAYARSLGVGLGRQGLHVLTVYPGPTRTAHARRYSPDNRREHRRMAPERLARLIWAAVERHEPTLIPGPANQLVARVGRLLPALSEYTMRKSIFEKL